MTQTASERRWRLRSWISFVFMAIGGLLIVLQVVVATLISPGIMREAQQGAAQVQSAEIDRERAREELVVRRFENASRHHVLPLLATALGSLAAVLVTLSGAILALEGYLAAREKERQDREAARDKEVIERERARQERLEEALGDAIAHIVAAEPRERVVGAAALQAFFTPDRRDLHLPALTALVAAARSPEKTEEVRQSIRIAVERAVRVVDHALLTQLSWQNVKLSDVNLEGLDLRGLDLRDATLENARLKDARLDGADLTNANLKGARMQGAMLSAATLSYADLAGATLAGATLAGAEIDSIQVLDLDLDGATLTGLAGDWKAIPWGASRNWRRATFDPDVRAWLDNRFGPEPAGPLVFMLMWEIPPLVAGGTWTACYHLVRKLRRRGANVTVIVPWQRSAILSGPSGETDERSLLLTAPFGSEVAIVSLGIAPPEDAGSPYAGASRPSGAWSAYGGGPTFWSGYGGSRPFWSGYAGAGPSPYAAPPYGWSSYAGPSGSASGRAWLASSALFRLIGEFRRRLDAYVQEHRPDLIHAHDWVTFLAARSGAERAQVPWIAHFHSTEAERKPDGGDPLIARIEQDAVGSAARIVAPSQVTRGRIVADYRAAPERIDVVPNVLSEISATPATMGRFETRRVIFLGRLSRQKGIDRFGEIAELALRNGLDASFEVFGDGEEAAALRYPVTWRGAVGWDRRSDAFRGASIVLVPSRAEPFGMVVLEAMEHRVPVIYADDSGAAEVLESGIKVAAGSTATVVAEIARLLGDLGAWEEAVRRQAIEITRYVDRDDETRIIASWNDALQSR